MQYTATLWVGIGSQKEIAARSPPGSRQTANEWAELMQRILAGKGYSPALYCFTVEKVKP